MLGQSGLLIAIILLAMLSAGGLAYAVLRDRIRDENQLEQRLSVVQMKTEAIAASTRQADLNKRRKTIQDTLKELEQKQKAKAKESKSPPLSLRLQQAGLNWSRRTFVLISIGCGVFAGLVVLLTGLPIYAVAAAAIGAGFGMPRWIVSSRRKRRLRRFIAEFPNAVDVIVRGVKAGLPLGDCLRIIAAEAQEPVKGEFRIIVDQQQALGLPLADAVARLSERIPVPEASFFAIVVTIQQKAGGNLSEALGNLSRVLRDRARMAGKIRAMSMEAKASGWIIGSLPVFVMAITGFTSPKYVAILFHDPIGNVILGAAALWMLIGVLTMKKMIAFKY